MNRRLGIGAVGPSLPSLRDVFWFLVDAVVLVAFLALVLVVFAAVMVFAFIGAQWITGA